MNNDLISREALKKALRQRQWHIDDIEEVMKIIDNAPTVEPFEPDYVGAERAKARQRGYEQGYHFGMEIGKTLNPKIKQGEWKEKRDKKGGWIECDKCGHEPLRDFSLNVVLSNYCPNCGTKMRKGGAE